MATESTFNTIHLSVQKLIGEPQSHSYKAYGSVNIIGSKRSKPRKNLQDRPWNTKGSQGTRPLRSQSLPTRISPSPDDPSPLARFPRTAPMTL